MACPAGWASRDALSGVHEDCHVPEAGQTFMLASSLLFVLCMLGFIVRRIAQVKMKLSRHDGGGSAGSSAASNASTSSSRYSADPGGDMEATFWFLIARCCGLVGRRQQVAATAGDGAPTTEEDSSGSTAVSSASSAASASGTTARRPPSKASRKRARQLMNVYASYLCSGVGYTVYATAGLAGTLVSDTRAWSLVPRLGIALALGPGVYGGFAIVCLVWFRGLPVSMMQSLKFVRRHPRLPRRVAIGFAATSTAIIGLGFGLPALLPAADAAAAAATHDACVRVVLAYLSAGVFMVVVVIMSVTHVLRKAMTKNIEKVEKIHEERRKSSGEIKPVSNSQREMIRARKTVHFLFWVAAGLGLPIAVPFLALLAGLPLFFRNSWLVFHLVAYSAVCWQTVVLLFWAK